MLIIAAAGINLTASTCLQPAGLLLLYLIMNVLYSLQIKKIPLLDIAFLVLGFLIRIFYGASLIIETVSVWLYLTVTTMSAYLGLGKRRNELQKRIDNNHEINGVLKFYTPEFLDKNKIPYKILGKTIKEPYLKIFNKNYDLIKLKDIYTNSIKNKMEN